jgi:probable rRNA maturation factor
MESKKSSNTLNSVLFSNFVPRYRFRTGRLIHLIQTILCGLNYRGIALSVVLVSDRKMKCLNRQFLKHNRTTDVLAFPFVKSLKEKKPQVFLGEIIVSPEQARIRARQFHTTFQTELSRYVCHGILHLSGFRDDTLTAQNQMRLAEDRLLWPLQKQIKSII